MAGSAFTRRLRASLTHWHRRRLIALLLANVVAILLALCGLGDGIEKTGRDLRDTLQSRSASGDIVLVAIDGRSLQKYDRWPWPRHLYARLIEMLGNAGVESVAFDVDFSARSNPTDDRLLAQAIERSPATIILPTFRQRDSAAPSGFIENLPLPEFRRSAFLAAVNVHTDGDGILRAYGFGEETAGVSRPSMGAMLAGASGKLGDEFMIDQSINPDSIPTLSFASVLSGRFDPNSIRGKRVIVGATAIELGDRYAVPLRGIQAGPVLQAQAGETLRKGRPFSRPQAWPAFLAATLILAVISIIDGWKPRLLAVVATSIGICLACGLLEMQGVISLQQIPAFIQLVLSACAWGAVDFVSTINSTKRHETRTGLPNGLALVEQVSDIELYHMVAVRFPRLSEAMAILGEAPRSALLLVIADRLRVGAGTAHIHLDGSEIFCWSHPSSIQQDVLADQFAGLASLFLAPIQLTEGQFSLAPRIGVAEGSIGEAANVLARASNAARQAEKEEKLWVLEDGKVAQAAALSQTLLSDLAPALRDHDIWVAYQAKMDIASGRIIGAEALMRWNHPKLGNVSPGDFIPLFEGEQVMLAPTLFVLDTVLADLRDWPRGQSPLNVAVNISSTLLLARPFIEAVEQRLAAHAELAEQLTFEVTESAAIDIGEAAIAVLDSWRARGVHVSIDDYGTGMSTLTYLRAFPASEIKIDQSFIRGLEHNANDRVLVRSTIELAHNLGMKVVAEGVEDAGCLDVLRELQCDVAQGWHVGRPVSISDFVAKHAHRAASAA